MTGLPADKQRDLGHNPPLRPRQRRWPNWSYWPVFRWWFMYVRPEKCRSCGRRWRDHRKECYFA